MAQTPSAGLPVEVRHEDAEPFERVVPDLVEVPGGVPYPEEPSPPAQEPVEAPGDFLDGREQPFPIRELTDAVTGMLERPARGPAGKENATSPSSAAYAARGSSPERRSSPSNTSAKPAPAACPAS